MREKNIDLLFWIISEGFMNDVYPLYDILFFLIHHLSVLKSKKKYLDFIFLYDIYK